MSTVLPAALVTEHPASATTGFRPSLALALCRRLAGASPEATTAKRRALASNPQRANILRLTLASSMVYDHSREFGMDNFAVNRNVPIVRGVRVPPTEFSAACNVAWAAAVYRLLRDKPADSTRSPPGVPVRRRPVAARA